VEVIALPAGAAQIAHHRFAVDTVIVDYQNLERDHAGICGRVEEFETTGSVLAKFNMRQT
jgi:hypothetical protein